MKKYRKKIQSRCRYYYNLLRNFGIKLCVIDILNQYCFKDAVSKTGNSLHIAKHNLVKKYLLKSYGYIIEQYKYKSFVSHGEIASIGKNAPIWVFWWQGIECAPDIVNICIKSLKAHCGSHEINFIDKYNINEYIDIPGYIMEKVEAEIITLTHFSDILRMSLLAQYGGIWSDATLFYTADIDKNLTDKNFYSIHHELYSDFHVCKGKWSGFFLATGAENPVFDFFRDMFYEYWKNEQTLCCYYLIDCIIALGYENIAYIKEQIDAVPVNNQDIFVLADRLNTPYSHEIFTNIKNNNSFHKLTYKINLRKYKEGQTTFYGMLHNLY